MDVFGALPSFPEAGGGTRTGRRRGWWGGGIVKFPFEKKAVETKSRARLVPMASQPRSGAAEAASFLNGMAGGGYTTSGVLKLKFT